MSKLGNEPASPTTEYYRPHQYADEVEPHQVGGLTKREHFAALVLAGLLPQASWKAYHTSPEMWESNLDNISSTVVDITDAVLKKLKDTEG